VFSEACNSGTPRRSNHVDEKFTARLHIDDKEIVEIKPSLAVIPSQAQEFKKLEKAGPRS